MCVAKRKTLRDGKEGGASARCLAPGCLLAIMSVVIVVPTRLDKHNLCSRDVFTGREYGRPERVLCWTPVFAGCVHGPSRTPIRTAT